MFVSAYDVFSNVLVSYNVHVRHFSLFVGIVYPLVPFREVFKIRGGAALRLLNWDPHTVL